MLTLVRTSVPTMEAGKYNVGKGKKGKELIWGKIRAPE